MNHFRNSYAEYKIPVSMLCAETAIFLEFFAFRDASRDLMTRIHIEDRGSPVHNLIFVSCHDSMLSRILLFLIFIFFSNQQSKYGFGIQSE